jgi:hypothetical protein
VQPAANYPVAGATAPSVGHQPWYPPPGASYPASRQQPQYPHPKSSQGPTAPYPSAQQTAFAPPLEGGGAPRVATAEAPSYRATTAGIVSGRATTPGGLVLTVAETRRDGPPRTAMDPLVEDSEGPDGGAPQRQASERVQALPTSPAPPAETWGWNGGESSQHQRAPSDPDPATREATAPVPGVVESSSGAPSPPHSARPVATPKPAGAEMPLTPGRAAESKRSDQAGSHPGSVAEPTALTFPGSPTPVQSGAD